MMKLRSHILALYVVSLVLAGFAWCAPATASAPHHHAHEAGAGHDDHGGTGEALHDCGMDEAVCACTASAEGVLPAVVTARDDRMDKGVPLSFRGLPDISRAQQKLSEDAPPDRRRRLTHSYDEIYGRTGRMLI